MKLTQAKQMWQVVRGPIAASVATLINAKWKPVDPTAWITSKTNGCSVSNEASSEQLADASHAEGHAANEVLHRLEEDLEAKLWKDACSAHNGSGLDEGKPNFDPAAKTHAKFARSGETKKAKAVELLVCNKVWSKKRLLDAGIITEEEAICGRCGEEVETDYHRYYACKANGCIEHEDVISTDGLATKGKR